MFAFDKTVQIVPKDHSIAEHGARYIGTSSMTNLLDRCRVHERRAGRRSQEAAPMTSLVRRTLLVPSRDSKEDGGKVERALPIQTGRPTPQGAFSRKIGKIASGETVTVTNKTVTE